MGLPSWPFDIGLTTPSAVGFMEAALATRLTPVAGLVSVPLLLLVSDPALIWEAGDKYGKVAGLVDTANTEMTKIVNRHIEHWQEAGRDAFVECRLRPYQAALDRAGQTYKDIKDTLQTLVVTYTGMGVDAAIVGATTLWLALMCTTNPLSTAVGDVGILRAATNVRNIGELVKGANKAAALNFFKLAARVSTIEHWVPFLLATGAVDALPLAEAGLGIYQIGQTATSFKGGGTAADLKNSVTPVKWPRALPDGSQMPAGYRGPTPAQTNAILVHHDAIVQLGRELDRDPTNTLNDACKMADEIKLSWPACGYIGAPIYAAHDHMRDAALKQLTAGRDEPGDDWLPGLKATAGNWIFAEQQSKDAVPHPR